MPDDTADPDAAEKAPEGRRRRWFSTRRDEHPAAATTRPPRRRRWVLWVVGALVLALLVWIGIEQLSTGGSTSPTLSTTAAPTTGDATAKAAGDPASIRAAIDYETYTTAGPVARGCALAVDPDSCRLSVGTTPAKFLSKPKSLSTAALAGTPAQTGDLASTPAVGARTVVLLTFTITATPTPQRWAVLVRDADHKVVGDQSIGAEQAGMTLIQVGQQIAEANQ